LHKDKQMRHLLLITFFIISFTLFGQKKGTTFGIQIKPIVPVDYFDAGPFSISDSIVEINVNPKLGFSFGMMIRHRFSKSFALETGISSVKRNYAVTAKSLMSNKEDYTDFSFVGYQIPIQGLIYIQLSEQIFMNTTAGIGIDMYPSSIFTTGENFFLNNLTTRQRWPNFSLLANLGFEYRTLEKGTFYIGGSFNRPFSPIALSSFSYIYDGNKTTQLQTFLNGNYITLDLRFFFPEKVEKK